jgi:hypothetical protein
MQDTFDHSAIEGLQYLSVLGNQPVRPLVEAFAAFLAQPHPGRKTLTEAVKAARLPTGVDIAAWMIAVGWVAVVEEGDGTVDITDLGKAILEVATYELAQPAEAVADVEGQTAVDTMCEEKAELEPAAA